MKSMFVALALLASFPVLADSFRDVSVSVSGQNDAWSCTNSLNAAIANAYNSCVLNGGQFNQGSIRACQLGPEGWYGSATAYCGN